MSCRDGIFYVMESFIRPSESKTDNERKRKWESDMWFENKREEANIRKKQAHIYDIVNSQYCFKHLPASCHATDVIEKPDSFSTVMPYYKHGSVEAYFPVNDIRVGASLLLQTLLALEPLHSRGVMHRDIKPENVLIKSKMPFGIVLADFGLSKEAIDEALTSFVGTPAFCAPEVPLQTSKVYGPKADIWSLGVVMLSFLCGLPPKPSLRRGQSTKDLCEWIDVLAKMLPGELDKSMIRTAQ